MLMNTLNIGWAEIDITPNKRVSLTGQFAKRISEYVEKPLTETALAMENGSDIATPEEVYDLLLERLPKEILQAWKERRKDSFSNAFGRAAVGMCRRVVYSNSSAKMWGDTNTAVFTSLEGGILVLSFCISLMKRRSLLVL